MKFHKSFHFTTKKLLQQNSLKKGFGLRTGSLINYNDYRTIFNLYLKPCFFFIRYSLVSTKEVNNYTNNSEQYKIL
jgi:hypothetical protein